MRGYEYETHNGYRRAAEDEYEDEYYSQDEYEDEGSGYVEEEEEAPPEGQQEFLQIRERLKEEIRQKALGAGASKAAGRSSSSHDRRPPPANFGSFFGPSKPVISQRVIEERKSMKEIQNTVPRDRRPPGKDIPSSSRVPAKTNGFPQKKKIVNEVKKKAEALKDNRDYSFLLSDDADIPSPPREKSAARPALTQKSDRELQHSAVKNRAPVSQPARLSNGYGSNMSTQRQSEKQLESKRKEAVPSRERERAVDNGRMHSVDRNGSSQASGSKAASQKFPSKGHIANKPSMKEVNEQSLRKDQLARKQILSPNGRPQSSQSQRMQSASHGQRPQQSLQSQKPQQSSQSQRPQHSSQRPQHSSQSQRPQQSSQSQRPQQSSQSQRPQQSSQSQRPQQSSQSQRPQQSSLSQRPQQSLQRQRPPQSSQLQSSQSQRQPPQGYRPQQPLQRQRPLSTQAHYPEQRRVQANDRSRSAERQPSRQVSANGIRDDRAKKKQLGKRRFNDEIEDEEDPMAMIRNMFGYDPSRYAGRDDDDSDMEADFATIEMEEKRSARIARQEDDEELRRIEEEERRAEERKRRRVGNGR